jgi:intracellular sulfur oxidation DsrE/DsrF family protein
MRRGVVFMSCHNAIWEQAAALVKANVNPDKLSHAVLAAELTNHLVDGVVLIPGATGTLPELQRVGFYYAK